MSKPSRVERYALDPVFEAQAVLLSCSRPRFYGRIGHAILADALSSEAARLALGAAHQVARDLGHGPESTLLVVQRLRRLMDQGQVSLEQLDAVCALFDEAEDHPNPPSEESVCSELAPVIRRRLQMDAVRDAVEQYGKRGDFARVMDCLAKAAAVGGADLSVGTRLGPASFTEIAAARKTNRLSTGILELDDVLDGGMERGALGMWIGGAGDGKSMALSHLGAAAILGGLSVLYATLELPRQVVQARLIANLTDVPIGSILDGETEAEEKLATMAIGPCVVQDFTPHATTVHEIREWVAHCEEVEGRRTDLLIVDYADKLSPPPKEAKGEGDYTAMRAVYEGLRVYAAERGIWCWTASQATRPAKDAAKRMDLSHVADSMHKVRVADLVVTLNARDDGANMLFFVAKNRNGRSRATVGPLPTEFGLGRIAPVVR